MNQRRWLPLLAVPLTSLALVVPVSAPTAQAAPTEVRTLAKAAAKTSATERKRVDKVKAPKIKWFRSTGWDYYLATVKVPLDYDKPKGAKIELALAKYPAKDQAHKIGTLFVNPGGPGGSATQLAAFAGSFLSESVLKRFDIVGIDPRGTNNSQQVSCFKDLRSQVKALKGFNSSPLKSTTRTKYYASAKNLAKGCSNYGKSVASAMSTAEVARDMDVLRRSVGDKKLNYLGFSYGSYLGEVYAAMFPDRFRALVIDGVLSPSAWRGSKATDSTPMSLRLKSADGSWKALQKVLQMCDTAGPTQCPLTNSMATFKSVSAKLRQKPLVIDGYPLTYEGFLGDILGILYAQYYAAETITSYIAMVADYYKSGSSSAAAKVIATHKSIRAAFKGHGFSYNNSLEAYSSVVCTDARQPRKMSTWPKKIATASAKAPYFSEIWGWQDVQCATSYWKAKDEDRYSGKFSKSTAKPILIVGNTYDPATNYSGAVRAHQLLTNSYLLSSNSWGHTAYGSSTCATSAVDNYLLSGKRPPATCKGDYQPFTDDTGRFDSAEATSVKFKLPITAIGGLPTSVRAGR